MYDSPKVLTGLLIFALLITLPVWYNCGDDNGAPTLVKPAEGTVCVAETKYMREYHMDLLNDWRDEVVREGKRTMKGLDGKTYDKSLTNTCLKCHNNKKQFCDKCHDYASVKVYCWDCHLIPEELN